MTDASANGRASKETYLRWRERLAEKHTVRREPAAASPTTSSNPWDPALLFVTAGTIDLDAPDAVAIDDAVEAGEAIDAEVVADVREAVAERDDVDETSEQTIDLRVVGAAAEQRTRPPDRAPTERGEIRSGRVVDLTLADPEVPIETAPHRDDAREDRDDAVRTRLEHAPPPVRPLFADTALAEALRDLNERRLEGTISDEQFRAQKAELFQRSSKV